MKEHGLALAARVYWDGARSWAGYLVSGFPDDKRDMPPDDFGWHSTSPRMVEAWQLYDSDQSYHHRKNLGSEWARLDAERAYKLGAFLGCALAAVALLAGVGLGVILSLAL